MFLLWASVLSSVFFVAQYLQIVLGYGPLDAGPRLLPWVITVPAGTHARRARRLAPSRAWGV